MEPLMRLEFQAWHETNRTLMEATGLTWDDEKIVALHAAIIYWSEVLVALRTAMPEHITPALNEARRKAERLGVAT